MVDDFDQRSFPGIIFAFLFGSMFFVPLNRALAYDPTCGTGPGLRPCSFSAPAPTYQPAPGPTYTPSEPSPAPAPRQQGPSPEEIAAQRAYKLRIEGDHFYANGNYTGALADYRAALKLEASPQYQEFFSQMSLARRLSSRSKTVTFTLRSVKY